MKKSAFLLASGAALALAATPLLAQQTGQRAMPGFLDYIGGGLAISDVPDLDNGTALVVNAGKNLAGFPGLALEGEFTTTISKPEASIGSVNANVSYWTLGGYGVYSLPVAQQFDVRGRLGILYEHVDASGDVAGGDQDGLQVSAGVGASFRVSDRFSVTADYTRISSDINHIGAGVRMRF